MHNLLKRQRGSLATSVVIVLTFIAGDWIPHLEAQETQPEAQETLLGKIQQRPDGDARTNWLCPMHKQVKGRQAGQCPICGMKLLPFDSSRNAGSMELDRILATALKNNPEVKAAEAKVLSAKAHVEQVRLNVVRQVVTFREKRRGILAAVQAAETELAELEKSELPSNDDVLAGRQRKQIAAVRESLRQQQQRLAEVDAELPFLLGGATDVGDRRRLDRRALLRDDLLPKARQLLELRMSEYQAGKTSILQVAAAERRLAELEMQATDSRRDKISIARSHKRLLEDIRAIATELYKLGKTTQGDVIAIELELSRVGLQLFNLEVD